MPILELPQPLPFPCPKCNRSFISKRALIKHMGKKHPVRED